jgi:hypothetical protein
VLVHTNNPQTNHTISPNARSYYESYSGGLPPKSKGPWDSMRLIRHWCVWGVVQMKLQVMVVVEIVMFTLLRLPPPPPPPSLCLSLPPPLHPSRYIQHTVRPGWARPTHTLGYSSSTISRFAPLLDAPAPDDPASVQLEVNGEQFRFVPACPKIERRFLWRGLMESNAVSFESR